MLTVSPAPIASTTTVRMNVTSSVVRLAFMHVAEHAGWGPCQHEGPCSCLTISDHWTPPDGATILVVRDAPAPCQEAIQMVMEGQARSIVLWNDPEALLAAFEAVRHQSTLLPNRVIDLATRAPRLTGRQRDTLRLLAAGRSNRSIAAGTCQSISTTKRDISELLEIFDVPNRGSLISAATSLGFVAGRPGAVSDHGHAVPVSLM